MAALLAPATWEEKQPATRDYLSFSAISTFQACSLRYYYRYVLGLPERTISASLVMGSAIHACLQFHFEALLAGNNPPSLDELLDVFQDYWKAHVSKRVTFNKGENVDVLNRLADRMLKAFQASSFSRPSGTIIAVEEELRGELIPGVPDLLARVDLVIDEGNALAVTDFKTARSSWSMDHVEEASSQLLLYHELAKDLADGRPVKLAFGVLTKTKVPEFALHHVEVHPRSLDRTRKVVERAWHAIQAGHFLPSPSPMQCPTCPFREPCGQGKW